MLSLSDTGYLPLQQLELITCLVYSISAKSLNTTSNLWVFNSKTVGFQFYSPSILCHWKVPSAVSSIHRIHFLNYPSCQSAQLYSVFPPKAPRTNWSRTDHNQIQQAQHLPKRPNQLPSPISHPIHRFPHIITKTPKMVQPRMVSHYILIPQVRAGYDSKYQTSTIPPSSPHSPTTRSHDAD
jgi:hypothetical protein